MSTIQQSQAAVTGGEPQLSPEVRERLSLYASHLRMLPGFALEALKVARNSDSGIHEFAAVIERDTALAADVLRLANSIMFSAKRPVMNLHQAVARVGFRQCKSLIIASSFSSMMKTISLSEEWIRDTLRRHSFITALLGLHLNRSLNVGFQGEEFTGGLIHDVGRMLLATCYLDQFSLIDPMDFDESPRTLLTEQAAIAADHCEVGVWFTQKNLLPEPLIDVVRFHHFPERSISNRRLVALISACDHMANHLQRNDETTGYVPSTNASIELLEECGVPHAVSRFAEMSFTVMETALRDAVELMSF